MRASRLLSILLALTVRGRVSAAQLAAELEVSPRTIYRDVEALNSAGVPIYATRGRAGGFQLLDGYRTRLTGMTTDEADALFFAGLPGAAADLGLGGVLAATQLKLLAALPPELRERAARIRDRFYLDAPGWLREADRAAVPRHRGRGGVDATASRCAVRAGQPRRGRPRARAARPRAQGRHLVPGRPAGRRRRQRTAHLPRVAGARGGHARVRAFERPDGFELETFWADYQRGYARRVYSATAVVRLSPQGRELLFLIGTIAARRARATMSAPDAAGWVTARVPIESVRHGAARPACSSASTPTCSSRPNCASSIGASARALAARYESRSGASPAGVIGGAGARPRGRRRTAAPSAARPASGVRLGVGGPGGHGRGGGSSGRLGARADVGPLGIGREVLAHAS